MTAPAGDPAGVTAAFLRRLPDAGWCPPEGWVADVNRRAGTTAPLTPDALAAVHRDTAAAADEFAAGYWDLPPAVRRAGWDALAARPADRPTGRRPPSSNTCRASWTSSRRWQPTRR